MSRIKKICEGHWSLASWPLQGKDRVVLGKKERSLLMSVEMHFGLIMGCAWNLLLPPLPAIYYAAAAKCQSSSKKFWWEIENLANVNATEITSPPSRSISSKKSLLERTVN